MFQRLINRISVAFSNGSHRRQCSFEGLEGRVFLSAAPLTLAGSVPLENNGTTLVATAARKTAKAAAFTIIDHASVAAVANLPQATMDRIATRLNFFFAHASVGGNIIDGARILHTGNGQRFKLTIASASATPG